jgi:hypothetical protein
MRHPPEGGAEGLEDRVKPPARPGSVVPSFAKPAKLGQPRSFAVRARNIKDGPALPIF